MTVPLRNVLVIGGSYVGLDLVKELASSLPKAYRIVLVEPHSHLNHVFTFPRFSVLPSHEHKAFIPYSGAFASAPQSHQHVFVQARVISLKPDHAILDQTWNGSTQVSFDYAVVTTGTRLPAPGSVPHNEKDESVKWFQAYQHGIEKAKKIIILGGGAVGVQMATDLKDVYPEKDVTLIHSRERLMPLFHNKMNEIICDRFRELGINLITGSRATILNDCLSDDGFFQHVELNNGQRIGADLVVPATGQTPNSQLLDPAQLSPKGFIKVLPNLQLQHKSFSRVFAAGDVADTGAHKAARPGSAQAAIVARNILALINGQQPTESMTVAPAAIHLSLGLRSNLLFTNPHYEKGETAPKWELRDDGEEDLGAGAWWDWYGVTASSTSDYHI